MIAKDFQLCVWGLATCILSLSLSHIVVWAFQSQYPSRIFALFHSLFFSLYFGFLCPTVIITKWNEAPPTKNFLLLSPQSEYDNLTTVFYLSVACGGSGTHEWDLWWGVAEIYQMVRIYLLARKFFWTQEPTYYGLGQAKPFLLLFSLVSFPNPL